MTRRASLLALAGCCLLLALSACGNKGPLVPAAETERQQQQRQQGEDAVE